MPRRRKGPDFTPVRCGMCQARTGGAIECATTGSGDTPAARQSPGFALFWPCVRHSMNDQLSRLLVVDDDPSVLVVVERFASQLEFEVIVRDSGREALASLAEVKPDAALVDLQMPELGGIDVLKAIR